MTIFGCKGEPRMPQGQISCICMQVPEKIGQLIFGVGGIPNPVWEILDLPLITYPLTSVTVSILVLAVDS